MASQIQRSLVNPFITSALIHYMSKLLDTSFIIQKNVLSNTFCRLISGPINIRPRFLLGNREIFSWEKISLCSSFLQVQHVPSLLCILSIYALSIYIIFLSSGKLLLLKIFLKSQTDQISIFRTSFKVPFKRLPSRKKYFSRKNILCYLIILQ